MTQLFHDQLNELLISSSLPLLVNKARVLEIGSHRGRLTQRLAPLLEQEKLYTLDRKILINPNAKSSICADAEALPFDKAYFDWIVSGGTFQWFENESQTLEELYRLTKPGGTLSFSQFVEGSMEPLGKNLKALKEDERLLKLKNETQVRSIIEKSCWKCLDYQQLSGTDWFQSFPDSLRFLREIGATRVLQHRYFKPSNYKKLCLEMQNSKTEVGYPLQWEAIVVVLQKLA